MSANPLEAYLSDCHSVRATGANAPVSLSCAVDAVQRGRRASEAEGPLRHGPAYAEQVFEIISIDAIEKFVVPSS